MQIANDCSTFNDIMTGTSFWSQGAGDNIYYNSGTTPRVGIATGTPAYTLDVDGDIRLTGQLILEATGGLATPAYISLSDLDDVDTTGVATNNVLQYNGTTWVPGAGGGSIWLQSSSNIYYSSGNVGIGTSTPTSALHVIGDIQYTGVLTDLSDRRLKDRITPLENALDGILTLQGYSYVMKDDPAQTPEYGLMAQDVETVFPVLVKTDDNGTKSLNYSGLIAPMIESIKAQQQIIDEQKSAIAAQKEEINTLKARMDALEQSRSPQ